MDMQTKYSIDASVLIDLVKLYPRGIFQSLWENLTKLSESGLLEMIWQVADEVQWATGDHAKDIVRKVRVDISDLTSKEQELIQLSVKDILANHREILWSSKGRVTSAWDPWIIAHAEIRWLTVVSQEKRNGKTQIPDICSIRKINCINFLEFLEELGWKL
jgi:Domain of unknown function (DUF4411)